MSKPSTRVTTPECVASYPNLFVPSGPEGADPKFSVTLLIPKTEDISTLQAAVELAIDRGATQKWGGKKPAKLHLPIQDGDEKTDADGNPKEEFAGHWYINASAKANDPPAVVDQQLQPVEEAKEIYGGVVLRAAITAFPYTFSGKKGVSFYLNRVQKVRDGEAFGVRVSVEDDFS